jgi:taurine dioxygenase
MFTNMYMAYDTLSDGMKKMIEGLHGIHTGSRRIVDLSADRAAEQKKLNPPIAQPVVRVHPETGRKALYTSDAHTVSIKGWTEKESLPLLEFLWGHQVKPEFTCRLSRQADPHGHPVCAGWHHRLAGARCRPTHVAGLGPAGCRRQSPRRQWGGGR